MTNETDVIRSLREKEEDLDGLLREAKKKASKMKEDALHRAEEMKVTLGKELDLMLEEYKTTEMEKIGKEAEAIKKEAIKKAEGLRLVAEGRMEEVIETVMHHILEGNE